MRIKVGDDFIGPLPSDDGAGVAIDTLMVVAQAIRYAREVGMRPVLIQLSENDATDYEIAVAESAIAVGDNVTMAATDPMWPRTVYMGTFMGITVECGAPYSRLVLAEE